MKKILFLLCLLCSLSVVAQKTFVHPGIWHKKSDLERMKSMVEAKINPWYQSYLNLSTDMYSGYDYSLRKDLNDNTLSRENPSHQRYQYEADVQAAYQNALMWVITGDSRHADKTIEILNAWSSLTSFYGGGTEPLCAGLYGAPMVNAAEIIKSTYDGWAEADIQKFKDMLVYPGYSSTKVPQTDIDNDNVTFYWRTYQGDPGRHGNQGLLAWRTVMSIGIFLDNDTIYDRAFRQIQGLSHQSYDLEYPSGPPIVQSSPNSNSNEYFNEYSTIKPYRYTTIKDYGYDDQIEHYIYDNGQCQESSRDQSHSGLGIAAIAELMEIAWNQGDDIYSFLDNRLLKGLEYTLKYNLSSVQAYPDQTTAWEPIDYYKIHTRTGRWESLKINPWVSTDLERNSRGLGPVQTPKWEMPAAHFNVRFGLVDEAKWLLRTRDWVATTKGYERSAGTGGPGWGGLSYHRPEGCAGDPISGFSADLPVYEMAELPGTVEAENYDYFSGDPEGRVYHDNSEGNAAATYRQDDVDVIAASEGAYAINDMEAGEWITYTCAVTESGTYKLDVLYAAANSKGTLRLEVAGEDKTGDVLLSSTGSLTTWASQTVSSSLTLSQGVNSFRILVGGESGAYSLNSFSLALLETNTAPIVSIVEPTSSTLAQGSSTTIVAEASDAEGAISKVEFYINSILFAEDTTEPFSVSWKYLQTGVYTIEAVATDNDRVSTTSEVYTVTVTPTSGGTQGGLLLDPVDDSYVHNSKSSTTFGSDVTMVTKSDGRYVYMKFDLNEISGPISYAFLKLYSRSNTSEQRTVYQVRNDTWTEEDLTWAGQPLVLKELKTITVKAGYNSWDLSSYVSLENGGDRIVSICIKDANDTGNGIDFFTKENGENMPSLTVAQTVFPSAISAVESHTLSVYPNPVDTELHIATENKYSRVSLFDLSGQLILDQALDMTKKEFVLDMSSHAGGIYILTLKGNNGLETMKIMKQ